MNYFFINKKEMFFGNMTKHKKEARVDLEYEKSLRKKNKDYEEEDDDPFSKL